MCGRNAFQALICLALPGLAAYLSPAIAAVRDPHVLVVCADPNNLPFSNRAGQGFENRIAELVAHAMNVRVRYVWWAQRRGYVRNTLTKSQCDLWPGVASGVDTVATTDPYYRSTYVFVTRAKDPLTGLTLDDPRLRSLIVGVQMIGNDAMNTPPAHALARRGITQNVRGYTVYGDYEQPNPPARIIAAVGTGALDVALVWGPVAGYFCEKSPVKLRIEAVTPAVDAGVWPMAYDIAVGVDRAQPQLRARVNEILRSQQMAINEILHRFHVPLSEGAAPR